ncbi:Hypothetical protein MVR_LOCUS251 [uncultured virus]|nr:Hypothetical protein MVR_LOCUS251 [uncultured virus]
MLYELSIIVVGFFIIKLLSFLFDKFDVYQSILVKANKILQIVLGIDDASQAQACVRSQIQQPTSLTQRISQQQPIEPIPIAWDHPHTTTLIKSILKAVNEEDKLEIAKGSIGLFISETQRYIPNEIITNINGVLKNAYIWTILTYFLTKIITPTQPSPYSKQLTSP